VFGCFRFSLFLRLQFYQLRTHNTEGIGSAVILLIATGYELNNRGGGSSSPGRVKNCPFFISFRPALMPTQPLFLWLGGGWEFSEAVAARA
jgi:hypothetical protein